MFLVLTIASMRIWRFNDLPSHLLCAQGVTQLSVSAKTDHFANDLFAETLPVVMTL